jgi:DNA ligase 1
MQARSLQQLLNDKSMNASIIKALRPLLAYDALGTEIKFPVICSPKIDGIRCLVHRADMALSRSGKPIRNNYVRNWLQEHMPSGSDGELTSGKNFQASTSGIMTETGKPDFRYFVFDNFLEAGPYSHRISYVEEQYDWSTLAPHAIFLRPKLILTQEALDEYEQACIEAGAEGVMIRDPNAPYKHGRSTAKEGILGKLKRFEDREAMIVGIEPLMQNDNPAEISELGFTKRSSHKSGKVAQNKVGRLVVRDICKPGWLFKLGSGLDDATRIAFWDNPPIGKICKYKFQPHGTKDLPRTPIFMGIRDEDDMDPKPDAELERGDE